MLTTTLPPAQLTKRDYAEIAEILNGTDGTRNGTNYWFDGFTLRLNWIKGYKPATSFRGADWKTIEEDYELKGLFIDEDLALWWLDEAKNGETDAEREDAKRELEYLFVTAAI